MFDTMFNHYNVYIQSTMQVGTDDGILKFWRDTADSETNMNSVSPSPNIRGNGKHSVIEDESEISLASAFVALPDVADTTTGYCHFVI